MKSKKLWIGVAVLAAIAFLVFFFTPRESSPSMSTRVILEHTHRTYIAPSCFEEAGATNYLEEADLQRAIDSGYLPHSECTEESFKKTKNSPFTSLMKELGIMEKDSKDW